MQNIINSFKATLYERTSSPLLGSFIFYWIICNYKFLLIILDDDLKILEKFKLIDETIYPTIMDKFYIGFFYPLVLTLIYIFIIPFFGKKVYKYSHEKQKELKEIKQKIDDETPLTKQESKKILKDFYSLQEEYNILLKNFNNISSETNVFNNNSEKDKMTLVDKKRESIINNDKIPLSNKILYLIGEYGDHTYLSTLRYILGLHPSQIKSESIELEENGLIILNKGTASNNEHPYSITSKGEKFLLDNTINSF